MTMNNAIFSLLFSALFVLSCSSKSESGTSGGIKESGAGQNHLSMKINGVYWVADHDVFGAFHPKGYNNAIIIAGSKGPKDSNEQAFNINLYNAGGAGTYHLVTGNPDLHVAQISNWSTENFLCGSSMGFDLRVLVTSASTQPDLVEATFEGKLICNTGEELQVTEGKFYYHE